MAARAFTVGGVGAQPGLEDVVKVALGYVIALDPAGSERVKKESPPPKSFEAEPNPDAADGATDGHLPETVLSKIEARAVLIARLLTLMNGKSGVRLQVAEFLRELLNRDIVPALACAASDTGVLQSLADACKGLGSTLDNGSTQPLSTILQQASITPPSISSNERLVLQSGGVATAGIAALTVTGGRRLLSAAIAVAALSCEAFGAQVA